MIVETRNHHGVEKFNTANTGQNQPGSGLLYPRSAHHGPGQHVQQGDE